MRVCYLFKLCQTPQLSFLIRFEMHFRGTVFGCCIYNKFCVVIGTYFIVFVSWFNVTESMLLSKLFTNNKIILNA